jgi:hypothetical protein
LKAKFEAKLDHTGHRDNKVSERNHHHTIISEEKGYSTALIPSRFGWRSFQTFESQIPSGVLRPTSAMRCP